MCVCVQHSHKSGIAIRERERDKKKHFGKWMCQVSTGAIVFVNQNEGWMDKRYRIRGTKLYTYHIAVSFGIYVQCRKMFTSISRTMIAPNGTVLYPIIYAQTRQLIQQMYWKPRAMNSMRIRTTVALIDKDIDAKILTSFKTKRTAHGLESGFLHKTREINVEKKKWKQQNT